MTILHALDWFMDDLEEHIFDRRCRAQACKDMIEYDDHRPRRPQPPESRRLLPDGCHRPGRRRLHD